MHNQIFYVNRDGSHGCASELPEGGLQISVDQYRLISENPGLIDVKVVGNVVRITASLISYKGSAVERIRKLISPHMPSESHLNHLMRAVICKQACFDLETTKLLSPEETVEHLERLNLKLNACLQLQSEYIYEVHCSIAVHDVDVILDKFERALQDIV